jgi:hypothetical protein
MSRSIWGKLGREYYSWLVEDMDELETFIIEHNIDVDYRSHTIGSWYSLRHQLTNPLTSLTHDTNNGDTIQKWLTLHGEDQTNKFNLHNIKVERARIV